MNILPSDIMQWAMHPRYLEAHTRRSQALGGLMPLALGGGSGRAGSFAPASPVREGRVLIVPIFGMLAPRGMFNGGTAYEDIADRVYEAGADREVSAVILDIRSPGGTVWGCSEAGDAIYATRSLKPIVAVASPYCFSAAYWLATQAGSFYATKSGEVGSVGVRTSHTDMSGFERKVGIRTTLIGSSRDKIAAHQFTPLSDEDRADMQSRLDETNASFVRAISRGRRMLVRDVAPVHGRGGTFSAPRAMMRGPSTALRRYETS